LTDKATFEMPVQAGQIRRGLALAGMAALLFGMTAPLLKRASAGVGTLAAASFLYMGAGLGAALAAALRPADRGRSSFTAGQRARIALLAALGAVVGPALLVAGLRRIDGATASLLLALEAPFTIALARVVLGEFIGRRVLVAAVLILAGGATLLVASAGSRVSLGGIILVVAAMVAWSVDNLLSRGLADRDPLRVVALKGLLGAAVSGGGAIVVGEARPPVTTILALMGLGALGYGVSLQLYLRAQSVVGAARTASIFATAPFVGVLVAFAFGASWPGVELAIAGLLIAAGVALHISERHEHLHEHVAIRHEHMHRHDDGHHQHRHNPMPLGPHSHPHEHEAVAHRHEHSEDLHHRHVHDDRE
jgi:drug/metabolite transporter (DMT)-like permease